jgi:hypothetical protein
MHKSIPEYYNMINSKTTLGLMAIFAASVLVTGALLTAPSSYASGDKHKDKSKDGVSGDGNTITIQINKGGAKAFGSDVTATNTQKNCLTFKFASC